LSTQQTRYIDGNLGSEGAIGVLCDMSAKKCVRMVETVFDINLEMIFPVPSRLEHPWNFRVESPGFHGAIKILLKRLLVAKE
jgi:hypothetical protein